MKAKQARKHDGPHSSATSNHSKLEQGDKPQVVYIDTMERGLALAAGRLLRGHQNLSGADVRGRQTEDPQARHLPGSCQLPRRHPKAGPRAYWEDPAGSSRNRSENGHVQGQWRRNGSGATWTKTGSGPSPRSSGCWRSTCTRSGASAQIPRDPARPQVNALLDDIVDNHGRSQADAVLAQIRNICNWYDANRAEYYKSPVVPKMKREKRKPEDRARKRFLNDNEIRLMWEAADQCGQFGALTKLALLTGQRRGRFGEKSTAVRWTEISNDGVWTFNQEDRRKGTPERIKLSPLALDIVAQQNKIDGNPFVFPGGPKGPFNHFSQGMDELRDKLPDMPHWTIRPGRTAPS